MKLASAIAFLSISAQSATWYVRPGVHDTYSGTYPNHPIPRAGVYGTQDGTSYANAWNGIYSINWAGGGVASGDTIYVCGTHIYYSTNANISYQAIEPMTNSGVTIRMDYGPDPGTNFGGMRDVLHTYTWNGPDGNGVYWSAVQWSGTAQPLVFEITNGSSIVRLPQQFATTWVGPGCYSTNSGSWITNYIRTLEGTAPTTNLATGTLGYRWDLYYSSNQVFLNCNAYSGMFSPDRSDNDVTDSHNGVVYAGFLGPKGICFTNGVYLDGSGFDLYPGKDNWIFSGCEIGRTGYGVYGFYASQTRGPDGVTVTGCHIYDTDTLAYPDGDGHGVGARDCSNWKVTHNHLERTDACVDFFCDGGATQSNNVVAYNLINDIHVIHIGHGTGSGDGIVFEGTMTAGTSAGNQIYGNVLYNIGLDASFNYQGKGIAMAHRDLITCYNNTVYNANVGISAASAVGLNCAVYNNIVDTVIMDYFIFTGGAAAISFNSDYNLIYPDPDLSTKFSMSPSAAHDAHSVFANPSFVSATPTIASDFRLNNGSPGLGAGTAVGIVNDFGGNPFLSPPAIGAWELVHHTYRMTVGNLILGP